MADAWRSSDGTLRLRQHRGSRHGATRDPPRPDEPSVADSMARLREIRTASGLTIRKLAELTGYPKSSLSVALRGGSVPSPAMAHAIIHACGGDEDDWIAYLQQRTTSVAQNALLREALVSALARMPLRSP